MSAKAYIQIIIPPSLSFEEKLCTISQAFGFSNNIYCEYYSQSSTFNITKLFDYNYDPSTTSDLQINLQTFLLPDSVINLGAIILNFYDSSSYTGDYEIINSCQFGGLSTTPGQIAKVDNVVPSSTIASQKYVTYIFHFSIQHSVPINGQFSIILAQDNLNGIDLEDPSSTGQTNCFLMLQNGDQALQCFTGYTDYLSLPYVNITCTSKFGNSGAPKNQDIKFKITGLTNPRSTIQKNFFKIFTTDENLNIIDQNQENQQFYVAMDTPNMIDLVTVSFDNQTNGAIATYTFDVVPAHNVISGDIFSIYLPQQLVINTFIYCDTLDATIIQSVSCLQDLNNQIDFHLDLVNPNYQPGQMISLQIGNITNPLSLRPTDNFTGMAFYDFEYQNLISSYSGQFSIQTTSIGQLPLDGVGITQSSYNPNEDSIVQLGFYTNNPLSNKTAIQVLVPNTLQQVYNNSQNCSIFLNGVIIKKSMCVFGNFSIVFVNAFQQFNQLYIGHIQLTFKTQNPTSNLNIGTNSYNISIFDDPTLNYGVDQLNGVLFPSLLCAYPCNTCSVTNTGFCLSCLQLVPSAPQYLTTFDPNQNQTCLYNCPVGFTTNGDNNTCTQCSINCNTCVDNGNIGDFNLCTSCKTSKPLLLVSQQKCVALCPLGTYQSNNRCFNCPAKCAACSDGQTCTKCNQSSNLTFIFNGDCLNTCPAGATFINKQCVQCNYPCSTCDQGLVNSCSSCDNSNGQQYFYGKSCFQICPNGTTQLQGTIQCVDCDVGCNVCDSVNYKKCLQCSQGFSIHDNICSSECPFPLQKSADGTKCNPRQYLLNSSFLNFPFLETAFFFFLVTMGSYFTTGRQSLVSSTLIAFFGPIEMGANAYLIYYTSIPSNNLNSFITGLIGSISAGVVVNVIFVLFFDQQIQNKDKLFIKWMQKREIQTYTLTVISGILSMTFYRLIFSKLYQNDQFNPNIKNPVKFIRPILIFTWIKFVCFNLPFVYMLYQIYMVVSYGNQAYITCLECFAINFFTLTLMIWESCNRDNLLQKGTNYINQHNYQKINEQQVESNHINHDKLFPINSDRDNQEEKIEISLDKIMHHLRNNVLLEELKIDEIKALPQVKKHQQKIHKLADIIEIVKKNKDLNLNNDMDDVLELQFKMDIKPIIRANSMVDKKNNYTSDSLSQESNIVQSLPGSSIYEKDLFEKFQQYLEDQKPVETEESLKIKSQADQYVDPEEMNIYFSAREKIIITFQEQMVQTDQEKGFGSKLQIDEASKDTIFEAVMQKREDNKYEIKKQSNKFRRGGKGFYKSDKQQQQQEIKFDNLSQIDEKSDQLIQLSADNKMDENQTLQINKSLNKDEIKQILSKMQNKSIDSNNINEQSTKINQLQNSDTRRMNVSRISGDLDFSESDDYMEVNSKTNVTFQIEINQRNFNVNDIIGNFERNWSGQIENKNEVLRQYNYRDREGKIVNEKGYLIDENTGDIISRYTKQSVFKKQELIGIGQNKVDIPIIYRLEKHNFSPLQILGNFDYIDNKLIVLKDNFGNKLDKNFRKVNSSGWLVDKDENVIDIFGHIKFIKAQLTKSEVPELYNYQGSPYWIKDVIGQFDKHKVTRQIIFCKSNDTLTDKLGRLVNSKGYLIDQAGNIINHKNEIIWKSSEVLFDEPPKIFRFTEFSQNWVNSCHNFDLKRNPDPSIKFDLNNRRINQLGYLIDQQENVIDFFNGDIIFKKEVLFLKQGQFCELPYVFLSGKLRFPERDEVEKYLEKIQTKYLYDGESDEDIYTDQMIFQSDDFGIIEDTKAVYDPDK